jgi:hypothetical protein
MAACQSCCQPLLVEASESEIQQARRIPRTRWNAEQTKQANALQFALAIIQTHGIGLSYSKRTSNKKTLRERWKSLRANLTPSEALVELVSFEDTLW